jgi:hypothetical protein
MGSEVQPQGGDQVIEEQKYCQEEDDEERSHGNPDLNLFPAQTLQKSPHAQESRQSQPRNQSQGNVSPSITQNIDILMTRLTRQLEGVEGSYENEDKH